MQGQILIPLIIFATIFGIFYVFLTTRNRERLALIEKGADASLFNTGKKNAIGSIILNLALLAIGIGVGVLGGAALEGAGMDGDVSFPASIFIFGGLGLVISFFINRKLEKE
jgi:preprotein translocase subunit YajC